MSDRATIRWCKHHYLPIGAAEKKCSGAQGICDIVTMVEVPE